MVSGTAVGARPPATRAAARRAANLRRRDLDGLRVFAIVLVVVYHVWLGRVSGGVDVFLLVSAYFLTASFLRRSSSLRIADLPRFWLRRFAQLLPAAAVTIGAVLAFAAVVLPPAQWPQLWRQAWASLTYWQNRALIDEAVDYYAREDVYPSALQHFWSLSVQGQVFLLWPVVILAAVFAARALRRSARSALIATFVVVFAASFAYSVHLTAVDQQTAYFSTGARLWEFALGSLAALLRVGRVAAAILGWGGILALLLCGIVLDVEAGFPGVAALWPTLAAVAIIAAGQGRASSASAFLGSRPIASLSRIAYALYLVHWPILIAFMHASGGTEVGPTEGLGVIALSVVAAWVLTVVVERVARVSIASVWRNGTIVLVSLLAVAIPLSGWQIERAIAAAAVQYEDNPGAGVLLFDNVAVASEDTPLVPLPTALDEEWIQLEQACRGTLAAADELLDDSCFQTAGADRAADVIVVLGDSHAQQMTGTLLPLAEERGWGVVTLIRGGCAMGLEEEVAGWCTDWREAAMAHAERIAPSAVATVVTRADLGGGDEVLRPGIEAFVDRFDAAGIPVIGVRDNPRFEDDMFDCAVEADDAPDACAVPLAETLAAVNPALALTQDVVALVDFTDWLCPEGVCQAVIGNVAVFMDDNHISGTYARTLAPALAAQLPAAELDP